MEVSSQRRHAFSPLTFILAFSLYTLAFLALPLSAQTNTPVRLALVGDSTAGGVAEVLDLATVKLSADPAVVLLDRENIRKVLAEHELSLAGALDANNVVSAGKLLSVDLFAVVDTITRTNQPGGPPAPLIAGLTVFNAQTGVRLWDATLSADGVDALAGQVADGVRAAQRKRVTAGLPTLCLMSVRNADLPRSLDNWCDSVGLLLDRRLTASLNCAVLERQRLDQVNQERSVAPGAADQQLLASLVILELECGCGPEGQGRWATAQLADNTGKVLQTFLVTNQTANADELAEALYQKISAALKLQPGGIAGERRLEADQFRQESGFFFAHGNAEHGLQDLEAAFALQPDDGGLRRQLAATLVGLAGSTTNLLHALRMADRGMDLYLDCVRASVRQIKPNSRRADYNFTHDFDEWDRYLPTFNGDTFTNAAYLSAAELAEAKELLRSLYQRDTSFRLDIALPALATANVRQADDRPLETKDFFHDYEWVMLAGLWSTADLAPLYPEERLHEAWAV